ncbi:MAG: FG-GAP repeat domain-containing protein, partial [Verrucomicrobiota bacterium]
MSFLPGWLAGLLAGTALAAERAERFGFTGPEVFPIDFGTAFLRPADFDGDGLTDLVVVNNARSRLTLLYNQTGRTNTAAAAKDETRRELNELPPDARFRIDSISSEKRISSLAVDDFNGDRRPDLAYFGDPKELVVQYNQGTNAWSTPRRFELSDGLLDANALSAGDLDGDGRSDLLLLAEKHVYLLRQRADGTLAEPEKLPYTGTVKAVQVLDVDGDRREDLVLVNWDSPTPFRFRL